MKKGLKIWFWFGAILLIGAGLFFWRKQTQQTEIITIPLKEHTELLFLPQGSTTKAVQKAFNCDFAVNGSYFWWKENGDFYPAGIWYENGQKTFSRENRPFDANLTNTIRFYQNTKKADFFFEQAETESISWTITFNAWPRLVQNNTINPELEQAISHWNITFWRTVLAKKRDQTLLVLFRKGITLHDTALWLQEQGFHDAINLDGGPSMALTSRSFFNPSFNEEKLLPIFFCVKGK